MKSQDKAYTFQYVRLGYAWQLDDQVGFILKWAADNIGFGELTFIKDSNGTICETECMSKKFIKAALEHFLNTIELVDK